MRYANLYKIKYYDITCKVNGWKKKKVVTRLFNNKYHAYESSVLSYVV